MMAKEKDVKLKEVKKDIRSVLITSKKGMTAQDLQKTYKNLNGSFIPYRNFGASNLHDFICSIPDTVRIGCGGQVYYAIADDSTQHIKLMVAKQKSAKNQRKANVSSPWRVKKTKPSNHIADKFIYFNKKNPWLPRFSSKQSASKNVDVSGCNSGFHFNNNLRKSSSNNAKAKKINSTEHVSHPISEEITQNLVKLLSEYSAGLHISKLSEVYKNKFSKVLPSEVQKLIQDKQLTDCASLHVCETLTGKKYIIFPAEKKQCSSQGFQEKTNVENPAAVNPTAREPLTVGQEYPVTIVHVVNCNEIFIHLKSDHAEYLHMQTCLEKSTQLHHAIRGKFEDAPRFVVTKEGLRAKIKAVKEGKADVFYVDTGGHAVVPLNQLFALPSAAAAFKHYAVCCSMHRPTEKGAEWHHESGKHFKERYLEAEMVMRVVEVLHVESLQCDDCSYRYAVFFYFNSFNVNARLIHEEQEITAGHQVNVVDPFQFQPMETASIPKGECFQVHQLVALSTIEVTACLFGECYSDKLSELQTNMWDYYSDVSENSLLAEALPLNCIYAVLYSDTCLRGRLVSVSGTEGSVYWVDYGITDTVELSALKPLKQEFCNLPVQAMNLCIAGLEHTPLVHHEEIIYRLNNLADFDAVFVRRVESCQNMYSSPHVELLGTYKDYNINISSLCHNLIVDNTYDPSIPESDNPFSACISHIEGEHVYMQIDGPGLTKLQSCLREIEEEHKNQKPKLADHLYINKLCLANIFGKLYRVKIEKLIDDKLRGICVILVDSGKSQKISRGSLYKIEREELLTIPPQVLCCTLSSEKNACVMCLGTEQDKHYCIVTSPAILKPGPVMMKFSEKSSGRDPHKVLIWVQKESNDKDSDIADDSSATIPRGGNSDSLILESSTNSYCSATGDLSEPGSACNGSLVRPKISPVVSTDLDISPCVWLPTCEVANRITGNFQSSMKLEDGDSFPGFMLLVKVEDALSLDYLQLVPYGNICFRENLNNAITEYVKKCPTVELTSEDIQVGEKYAFCCTKPQLPKCWYRVKVQSKAAGFISVYFIDYGSCEFTAERSMFCKLPCAFADVPPMIMHARLTGLESLDQGWSEELSARFQDLVIGKQFYAHCLKVVCNESHWSQKLVDVCLCDVSTSSDVWLDDILVNAWKCARYVC